MNVQSEIACTTPPNTDSEKAVLLNEVQEALLKVITCRSKLRNVLTIEELAEFMDVSIRTVQRWHTDDKGPPRIRRIHRLVYPIPKLLAWMAGASIPSIGFQELVRYEYH